MKFKKRPYLVAFYIKYSMNVENRHQLRLVYAYSFEDACQRIKKKLEANKFENLTIE